MYAEIYSPVGEWAYIAQGALDLNLLQGCLKGTKITIHIKKEAQLFRVFVLIRKNRLEFKEVRKNTSIEKAVSLCVKRIVTNVNNVEKKIDKCA